MQINTQENPKEKITSEEETIGDSRRSCCRASDLHRSGQRDDKKGGRKKKAAIYRGEGHWALIYLNRYPIGWLGCFTVASATLNATVHQAVGRRLLLEGRANVLLRGKCRYKARLLNSLTPRRGSELKRELYCARPVLPPPRPAPRHRPFYPAARDPRAPHGEEKREECAASVYSGDDSRTQR